MELNNKYINEIGVIVRSQLPSREYRLVLFGSRAHGKPRQWSDVDIAIDGNAQVPQGVMVRIQNALEESDIPYRVDVVDMYTAPKKFQDHVRSSSIPLRV